MGDWSSYSLSDFLLFSPQVYERLFVLHNQDLWPAQFLALTLGAAALAGLVSRRVRGVRAALVILGAAWLIVAAAFFPGRYQAINWLGSYIAPLAGLQGIALIAFGLAGRTEAVNSTAKGWAFTLGVAVAAFGLIAYPLIAPFSGGSIESAQVFGLMPDPTAVVTLGGLALVRGRVRSVLSIVPAAWCVFTALTLWALGRADFFVAPSLLALSFLAIAWPRSERPT